VAADVAQADAHVAPNEAIFASVARLAVPTTGRSAPAHDTPRRGESLF
jgi:hypothetical protein